MSAVIDLTGQNFNYLTVIERDFEKGKLHKTGKAYWKCQCKCGNIVSIVGSDLRNGKTQSCGCMRTTKGSYNGFDLLGKKFGKLTVLERLPNRYEKRYWKCECECGNIVEVSSSDLKSGHTYGCGCSKSKGEQLIGTILKELNFSFESQKSFDTCINPKTNKKLFFDFYLPDFNILIEYDGIQHTKALDKTNGWNNIENLLSTQERDSIKNEWCKNNNIPLIRISYEDFNKLNSDYLLERINNYE